MYSKIYTMEVKKIVSILIDWKFDGVFCHLSVSKIFHKIRKTRVIKIFVL